MTNNNNIPRNRLKYFRNRSRLTQQEIAKLLDFDVTLVSKHENWSRRMTDDQIVAYANVYKVKTHELFM